MPLIQCAIFWCIMISNPSRFEGYKTPNKIDQHNSTVCKWNADTVHLTFAFCIGVHSIFFPGSRFTFIQVLLLTSHFHQMKANGAFNQSLLCHRWLWNANSNDNDAKKNNYKIVEIRHTIISKLDKFNH